MNQPGRTPSTPRGLSVWTNPSVPGNPVELSMGELRQNPRMKFQDILGMLDLIQEYADRYRDETGRMPSVDFRLQSIGVRSEEIFIGDGSLGRFGRGTVGGMLGGGVE